MAGIRKIFQTETILARDNNKSEIERINVAEKDQELLRQFSEALLKTGRYTSKQNPKIYKLVKHELEGVMVKLQKRGYTFTLLADGDYTIKAPGTTPPRASGSDYINDSLSPLSSFRPTDKKTDETIPILEEPAPSSSGTPVVRKGST